MFEKLAWSTLVDTKKKCSSLLCSDNFSANKQLFNCPFEHKKCGSAKGNIELVHLDEKQKVNIDNSYESNSICWYQLSSISSVLSSDIYMNLVFTQLTNVDVYVIKAASMQDMQT